MDHAFWMHRCLRLARNGAGGAAPNPMVGAVLVHDDRLIAEGWHQAPGGPHAERACLDALGEKAIPADATLYVNMEPCAHHGRTPPCADLLIERGVRRVVVAHRDPFTEVNGQGIARLKHAGIMVIEGILADEAKWLNRRFLTSVTGQRPYIVLKWAQSADGFLDDHGRSARITSASTDVLVHRWRSEEQAILVGSRTVVNDDPHLDVRHVEGRSPLRVVLDRAGIVPTVSKLFDGTMPTLLFTGHARAGVTAEQVVLDPGTEPLRAILSELNRRSIRSLLVEGGAELHGHFIRLGLWDEARVISGAKTFGSGTPAPMLSADRSRGYAHGTDRIALLVNASLQPEPRDAWPW